MVINRQNIILIFAFILLTNISCSNKIVIRATKDAALLNNHPKKNFSGKKEAIRNIGYITKKRTQNGFITYPAMYLYSGLENNIKESFVLGGFDLSDFNSSVKHASLKFFINYSSTIRNNLCVFVRQLARDWDENNITYNDVYKSTKPNAGFTDIVNSKESDTKLIVFDVKENNTEDIDSIPFNNAKRTVSIDVTDIVNKWINDPASNHGFLIDPMWMNDFRYITTNEYKEISDFGIIEVASSEWFNWDGVIPESFVLKEGKWKNVKNKALNKTRYIPRLEITR